MDDMIKQEMVNQLLEKNRAIYKRRRNMMAALKEV